MNTNNTNNEPAATESHSVNQADCYQPKSKSTLLLILFALYAIIYAIAWKYKFAIGSIDLSILLLIVALYFRLARKKLAEGNAVKKYNTQTRKIALWVIYFEILITVVPLLLFIFGDLFRY